MKTEQVHSVVLGAGPAGLATGYTLALAGKNPVVLERDKVPGGLMRSIPRGDFIMDVGRKELYNRIAKVHEFWSKLLGNDYRAYPHRGGILYGGRIIDISPAYQGFRRGMPWSMFLGSSLDFAFSRLGSGSSKPQNLEEYLYAQRGRRLCQIASQGFHEKMRGKKWSQMPAPDPSEDAGGGGLLSTLKEAAIRVFSKKETNTSDGTWRHPAKGTGQICDVLGEGIRKYGGRILCGTKILGITHAGSAVESVSAEIDGEVTVFKPEHVASSIPLEFLVRLVMPQRTDLNEVFKKTPDAVRKTVILVYLFLDEPPRFPQAWLQVTCPTTRIGRITNYTEFKGEMVPHGKTCLCCEYYTFGQDPLDQKSDADLAQATLDECAKFHLVDPAKCVDKLVLRFPGADAAQNRSNWMSPARLRLVDELKQFKNLYYTNRTDLDIATLAGIESAEAILSGDRSLFDLHLDPEQLQIKSERKKFDFKQPPPT
jgi:protoporphyrinogen oxidase